MMLKPLLFSIATLLVASSQASAAIVYSQTQSGSVGFPDSTPVMLTFTGAIPAATDATLSLFATGGELALNNKRLEQLNVEGDTFETLGSPAGWIRPVNFLNDVGVLADPVIIPLADLNNYVIDGQVMVSVVRPNFISGGTFDVVLQYTSAVPEPSSGLLLALGLTGVVLPRRRGRSL